MAVQRFLWGPTGNALVSLNGSTTLGAAPGWLPAGTVSAWMFDDDGVVTSGLREFGAPTDRVMTDSEMASVQAMWADNDALHGPTPMYVVNADGTYAGQLMALGEGQTQVFSPPPADNAVWDEFHWTIPVDLATLQEDLLNNVDRAAGAARARYITVVAGQDATYIVKEQQAVAFIADPTMPVPGYIQAEADATGMTPLDAANLINNTAQQWGVLGPQIEMIRRRGNLAVSSATTNAEAMSAYQAAINDLAAV